MKWSPKIIYRNDDIDRYICLLQDLADLFRKRITHGHATPVDADTIQDRIGPRKVHILKNIRCENGSWGELAAGHSRASYDNSFTWLRFSPESPTFYFAKQTLFDVLPVSETAGVGNNAFAREEVVRPDGIPSLPHTKGSNTVRIPEGDDAKASKHGHAGIRSNNLRHQFSYSRKDIFFIYAKFPCLLEIVCKNVK